MLRPDLGRVISRGRRIAGGKADYFEKGCIWKGPASNNTAVMSYFKPPLIGNPDIVNPEDKRSFQLTIMFGLKKRVREAIRKRRPRLFTEIWQDRLILQQVVAKGKKEGEIPLTPVKGGVEVGHDDSVAVNVNLRPSAALQDRVLYNLGFNGAGGKTRVVAPHAFYTKESWTDFGFIHATDLHVSRRLEGFRQVLKKTGHGEGARQFSNCNDNVRDMIRYANHLHDIGMIDFFLATGDLIDYIFEKGDNRNSGGNFAFLKNLILGMAPSGDNEGSPNEELRVPIFMTLGNHDYRKNPYGLFFDIHVSAVDISTVRQYSQFNLTEDEARALQRTKGLFVSDDSPPVNPFGIQFSGKPSVSRDAARRMVKVDKENSFYFRELCDQSSYIKRLGNHRIVMINSKYDVGILDSDWDVAALKLGFADENQRNFAAGNPNSVGFQEYDIGLVRKALKEAGKQGLVVVGVHAPPFNPKRSEPAYYFRETAHRTLKIERNEVNSYLSRATGMPIFRKAFPDWMRTGTPFFKKGGIEDLMDWSISVGKTSDFLRLCAGKDVPRPVDLVLSGHVHSRIDFRIKPDTGRAGFLFYTDFYSENPSSYYPSYDYLMNLSIPTGDRRPINVSVKDGAPLNKPPIVVKDRRTGFTYRRLYVPPYKNPLNSSSRPKAWWKKHRPLLLQTSSIGWIDCNQRIDKKKPRRPFPAFQGFRVISVGNNVITKIRYAQLANLRQKKFRMPWEVRNARTRRNRTRLH